MRTAIAILQKTFRGAARVCRLVPLLPVVIAAALPLALLWDARPWGTTPWPFNPSLGQWVVILLVAYTVTDTIRGMIDDIRHGHVGVDILAVVAILSTLAVREYWASWAVTLMIASGEAIEEYAQSKAESNLTALIEAAPVTAHVANLPGVGANAKHPMSGSRRGSHAGSRGGAAARSGGSLADGDARSGATPGAVSADGAARGGVRVARAARAEVSADGFRRTVPSVRPLRVGDSVIAKPDDAGAGAGDDGRMMPSRRSMTGAMASAAAPKSVGVDSMPAMAGVAAPADALAPASGVATAVVASAFASAAPAVAADDALNPAVGGSTPAAAPEPAVTMPATTAESAPVAASAVPSVEGTPTPAVCGITGREALDCESVVERADAHVAALTHVPATPALATSAVPASAVPDLATHAAASPKTPGASTRPNPSHAPSSHFDTVPVAQVRLGDVLVVLPGETVPVDGELLSGSATLDLSAINGEPVPREVFAGARVMSGAVNGATTFTMRATELARDSQYQRIMELVSSAQSSRAAVVRTADLMAVPFTVIAFVIAGVAWMVSGVPTRFAQVLVLATPCPLLIAAPVAYMAGTGRLARHGILVKAQDVLENLGRVSHVFFDKTGTLTVKRPQVVRVERPSAAHGASMSDACEAAATPSVPGVVADAIMIDSPSSMDDASSVNASTPAQSSASVQSTENGAIIGNNAIAAPDSATTITSGMMKIGAQSSVSAPANEAPANTSETATAIANAAPAHANATAAPALATPASALDGRHLDDDHVLMFAGIVETYSVHILAEGIAAAGRQALERLHARFAAGQRECPAPESARPGHGRDYPVVRDVREDAGQGVRGEVNGHDVTVGRFAYVMESTGDVGAFARSRDELFPDALAADEMATYVAVDSVLVARLVLRDVPRGNAASTMERLRALGVKRLTMLTGDKEASARAIAGQTGIDDVHAELFPEDKVAAVRNATVEAAADESARPRPWWDRMIARMGGESVNRPIVMMVGDGVNDAPVLAASDIGMAITDGTSTAASESAQVVIMNDDIAGVADAIGIARRTKRVMLQAVGGGLALATVFMIAAAFNLIPVVVGAFIQEGIDVVSILWALLAATDGRRGRGERGADVRDTDLRGRV